MLDYLHMKNVGPAPELELDLAPRLNLLTGDNGLGKSFLLDIAWWALTRRWPAQINPRLTVGTMAYPRGPGAASIEFRFTGSVQTESYQSTFHRLDQAWTGRPGRPANPGLVLYAQVDGGFSVWDPARNYWKKRGNADIQERLPGYFFTAREVWDGLRPEGQEASCLGLIDDWARWQGSKNDAFQLLIEVLKELSPRTEETLLPGSLTRLGLDDVRDIPTLRMPYGQDVPVLQASAGMRRILALAYLLVWAWSEHERASRALDQPTARQVIFLIDEIEAHLHPRWQRTIVRSLLKVVHALTADADVQLVAATHSPLVMASVEPIFQADRDAWFDLDLIRVESGTSVQLNRRPFVRRGDAADWLTSEAFDLREATSLEAEEAIQAALALLARDDGSRDEVERVDAALRAALGDTDRFWMRWSQYRRSLEQPA